MQVNFSWALWIVCCFAFLLENKCAGFSFSPDTGCHVCVLFHPEYYAVAYRK